MSIMLRVVLVIVSAATFMTMIKRIRQAKVQIETSLFWVVFAAMLLLISIFPKIAYFATDLLGIQAPVNFVFLFAIFVLLVHQFFNSIKISQLENKVKDLTQELAVRELMGKQEK